MTSDKPVLVVDDTEIMRQGTVLTLRMVGFQTDEARDGHEALLKVETSAYSAILMDYNMAGMVGTECAAKIRELERSKGLSRTPIIGMTASTEIDLRCLCLESGMDDYIDKACSTEHLCDMVRKWTNSRTLATWSLPEKNSDFDGGAQK